MDAHSRTQDRLVSYLMHELNEGEARAVEAHLQGCPQCREMLAEYRQTLDAADALPSVEPPAGFTQRVLLSARAARAAHQRTVPMAIEARQPAPLRRRVAVLAGKLGLVAAAALLALLVNEKVIHDDSPARPASAPREMPSGMPIPPKGVAINRSQPSETRQNPSSAPTVALEDPDAVILDVPPLELPEPGRVPAFTQFPSPADDLIIARSAGPNPAYVDRQDWRRKSEALRRAGADSAAVNTAIRRGLWWLARHQDDDGKWDPALYTEHCTKERLCSDNGLKPVLSDVAVTSAALLAMLGDGHTPASGAFRSNVSRGINWLISKQQPDGSIGIETPADQYHVLSQALATAALSEAYGMTGDARVRVSAQKAVSYLASRQVELLDSAGNLLAGHLADAAIRMAALHSADTARLDVPREAVSGPARSLAQAALRPPSEYASPATSPSAASRITLGMLALLAPGAEAQRDLLLGEMGRLRMDPPDWRKNGQLYWLVGSAIASKAKGESSRAWFQNLQQVLVRYQRESGHAIGSWTPQDAASRLGGRVLSTAMAILALEMPYR